MSDKKIPKQYVHDSLTPAQKKKQIKKNALLKFDSKLANKYISIGESQIRFKVNDFRPYNFD